MPDLAEIPTVIMEEAKNLASFFSNPKDAIAKSAQALIPPTRDCKLCFWSDYQGVTCKIVDPPRRLTTTREAILCFKYTTTPPTSDSGTQSAVENAVSAIDNVKAATELVNTSVNLVKSATDTVKTASDNIKDAVDVMRSMVARPAWYDRNPSVVTYLFDQLVAADHFSMRWFYHIPSGRKAMVEFAQVSVDNAAAQNNDAPADTGLRYSATNSETWGDFSDVAKATVRTIAVGKDSQEVRQVTFFAGQTLMVWTANTNVTGYVRHRALIKITEFDA